MSFGASSARKISQENQFFGNIRKGLFLDEVCLVEYKIGLLGNSSSIIRRLHAGSISPKLSIAPFTSIFKKLSSQSLLGNKSAPPWKVNEPTSLGYAPIFRFFLTLLLYAFQPSDTLFHSFPGLSNSSHVCSR